MRCSTSYTRPAAAPLPVATILAAGLAAPAAAGRRFWLRAAATLAATIVALPALSYAGRWLPGVWVVQTFGLVVPATLVMVPLHRAALSLPDEPAGTTVWGPRETRYALVLLAVLPLGALAANGVLLLAGTLIAVGAAQEQGGAIVVVALSVAVATLAVAGLAWLIAPLALALPAIAAGRPAGPTRLWRLARGSRWRLTIVVGAYPVVWALVPTHAHGGRGWIIGAAALVIGLYCMLALAASASLAYHALSDPPMATRPAALDAVAGIPALSWAVPFGFAWVIAGIAGLWLLSEMPDGDRATVAAAGRQLVEGEERLLTLDKQVVELRYALRWRIVDERTYERAAGGDPAHVSRYVADILRSVLRETVARRELESLVPERPAPDVLMPPARLDERAAALGIEITERRIIELRRPP